MPTVTFIDGDGQEHVVTAESGTSVMQAAVDNDIDGIVGECGGSRTCATCHVYVAADFCDLVGPPDEIESELLDATASPRKPSSRLGCQIRLSDRLDGLVLLLPESQY